MNLLKNPDNYGKKRSCGRPQTLTAREKRAILRAASNSKMTARQIAENVGVNTLMSRTFDVFYKTVNI